MKGLRIKLTQQQAHYGRPECVDNRMTYPLPPYSTVIGAIHAACGYKEYHPMDISIQGNYQSMQKEIFTHHTQNNRREDDRGHLIYLQHPRLLTAKYEPVAKALKNQGNSFRNNVTIEILNRRKMQEYWDLLQKKDQLEEYSNTVIKTKKEEYKSREKEIKALLKTMDKKSEDYQSLSQEMKNLKQQFESMDEAFKKQRKSEYELPISHFKTLTKAPKYAEVLYGVELIIHVRSDDKTLQEIENNIYNLRSIGRSEDYVDVQEIRPVDLSEEIDKEYVNHQYSAYIKKELLQEEHVILDVGRDDVQGTPVQGTTFFLPKNYEPIEPGGKRIFKAYHKVCYLSGYSIDKASKNILVDSDGYIVDFV